MRILGPDAPREDRRLQLQVESQRVVRLSHDAGRDLSEDGAQALNGNRADLFGLGLGVLPKPGRGSGKQSLPQCRP
jgi:hypothetical protein